MKKRVFEEDKIYTVHDSNLTDKNFESIRRAIRNNYAVGFLTGIYDENLTITNVSGFLLHNLGYTIDEFTEVTKGSLKNLFYGENKSFLDVKRFKDIHGEGEGQMLTRDHVPVNVRLFKIDEMDENQNPFWILSVQMDWMQQNLHLVNETIGSGFWYIDCDEEGKAYKYVYSHEFRTMLGYHDILDFPNVASSWENLIHPEDKQRVTQALELALQDKTDKNKYDVEYRMYVKNKGYQWFKDSGKVNRRLDGTSRRMVGIFINIEDKKQAQKKQQRSDAFHRAYTEANLCEYYVNIKENTFESMKDDSSFLGSFEKKKNWKKLVHAYINQYVLESYKDSVEHLLNLKYIHEKIEKGQREVNIESEIWLDGSKRWVRNVVIRDENPSYAIVFVRDITQAKQEALHIQNMMDENRAMDLLIQGTVNMVDRYAACDLVNNAYRYYKKEGHQAMYAPKGKYSDFIKSISKHYKGLEHGLSVDVGFSVENIQKHIKKQDDIYRFEYCSLDEMQYKSVAISPLAFKDGKVEQVLLLAQDVTQEKKIEIQSRKALQDAYEAANRASKAKTEFLSNMSHDIRTPMNAIVGMTAIAGANIENKDRVLDCLSKITQSSRHLLGLINEVLDMSRIESGKLSLTQEDFNLSQLVDNIIAMNKTELELHQHEFDVKINKIEHEDVCGDSLRIQQMVTNILANSIKYTPDKGKILFSISEIETKSMGLGCFEFVVEDNGIGMSEEFQKVIFEPFTRADDKRTSKVQGTGLGMAIAQNFAHMMDGDIKVESQIGKGSKFTMTIFLKLQNKKIEKIEDFIDLPVLVVDDDEECCENTVNILKDIGIDGEYVTSGQAAVKKAYQRYQRNENYFAIIIDWKMPEMDGIETTRQIRKCVGKEVTIIILSAFDYSEIEEQARLAGVDEFIAKPLFRSRLTAALKNVLEDKPSKNAKTYLSNIKSCDYSNKNILLVEDNDLNREIAKEILEMTKAHVEVAHNGKEALDKIIQSDLYYYDLVFMDIQMPVMNGYESAIAIRTLDRKDTKNLPILAMTANAFAEDVVLAKNAGMNEHISKPLDMNYLYEVLQKWL